jgi:hypothetical protein
MLRYATPLKSITKHLVGNFLRKTWRIRSRHISLSKENGQHQETPIPSPVVVVVVVVVVVIIIIIIIIIISEQRNQSVNQPYSRIT